MKPPLLLDEAAKAPNNVLRDVSARALAYCRGHGVLPWVDVMAPWWALAYRGQIFRVYLDVKRGTAFITNIEIRNPPLPFQQARKEPTP